jgi:hypothetical protein
MVSDLGVGRDTLMAHYMSNQVVVACGNTLEEMAAVVALRLPGALSGRLTATSEGWLSARISTSVGRAYANQAHQPE